MFKDGLGAERSVDFFQTKLVHTMKYKLYHTFSEQKASIPVDRWELVHGFLPRPEPEPDISLGFKPASG